MGVQFGPNLYDKDSYPNIWDKIFINWLGTGSYGR